MHEDGFVVRRVTSNDGLSLYVRDYSGPAAGGRTPLLCLGGLTRNSKDFARIGTVYGAERRVLCPDTRGRGLSDDDPEWRNYHPATYVEDIRHILCALGVHEVVVVGTSMGGFLGMGMAAAMPGALKGLVLNDVGPVVEAATLSKIIDYIAHPPRLASWAEAGRHLRAMFEDQVPLADDAAWERAAHLSYKQTADGTITYDWDPAIVKPLRKDKTRVYDLWHLFEAAGRIPVLVVRGARSEILPAALVDEMRARHPDLDAVTVPEVGHAPTLNEPACKEALNDYLARV